MPETEIKMGSLFDGIGGWLNAATAAGVKPVWLSEIEPFPLAVTKKHYPDVPNLGSVTDIKGDEIEPVDIITSGSPCFPAGTLIMTDRGTLPIEEIHVGDKVIAEDGKFHTVTECMVRESSDIHEMSVQGMLSMFVTGNHPILARHMKRKLALTEQGKPTKERVFSDPEWIQVSDLKYWDFVGFPIIKEESNELDITAEEAWLIGRYIADGCIYNAQMKNRSEGVLHYRVILSVGKGKVDEVKNHLHTYHGSFEKTRTATNCQINNKRLTKLCQLCGKGAINKEIPAVFLSLPVPLLRELLAGYLSGDGYRRSNIWSARTVSRKLVISLQFAIHKVFHIPCKVYFRERPKTCMIEGRVVNQRNIYDVVWLDTISKQSNAIADENYIWQPIKSIEKKNSSLVKVYNLEVEDVHSYCANGIVVHNCQDLSVAGKQRGMVDGQGNKTRSGLFYDGMKIFNDMREKTNGQFPRFFVWENVCFSGDTLVLTKNGYHPISFVNEGDYVLTLSGQLFPVRKTHRTENQKVLSMQVGDSEPIKVTKNHPIYVREYDEGLWPLELKTVEEIQNSDKTYYAGYPVGQITYDSFGISKEMFDAKQFGKCIARLYLASERENYDAFPSFLYFLDTDIAKDIMNGVSYIIDTSVIRTRFKETAFFFANLIRNMLARTGKSPCVRKGKDSNWEVVEDSHPSIYQDDYVWLPITKIEDKGEITNVYNLSVEEDNSYTADGIMAHNCGAMQSKHGLDFKSVLEEVAGTEIPMPKSGKWANAGMVRSDRCEIAWRVLDSQFFGVAQRRRRVFLVADFRTGPRCAGQILFESQSLQRDTPKSGEQGQGASSSAEGSVETASRDTLNDPYVPDKARSLTARADGSPCIDRGPNVVAVDRDVSCLTPWDVQSKRVFNENGKFCTLQATTNNGEKPGSIFVDSAMNPWDYQGMRIFDENGKSSTLRTVDSGGYPNENVLVGKEESCTMNPWDGQANKVTSSNGKMPTLREGRGYPNSNIFVESQAAGFIPNNSAKARSLGYRDEQAPTLSSMDTGNKPVVVVYDQTDSSNAKTQAAGFVPNNSAKARSIGYKDEQAPTISIRNEPVVVVYKNEEKREKNAKPIETPREEFSMPKVSIRQGGKILYTMESGKKVESDVPVRTEAEGKSALEQKTEQAPQTKEKGNDKDILVFEPGIASRVDGHIYTDGKSPTLRATPGDNHPAVAYLGKEKKEFPVYRSFPKKEEAYAVLQNTRNELYLSDKMYSITCGGGKPGQGYPCIWMNRTHDGKDAFASFSNQNGYTNYSFGCGNRNYPCVWTNRENKQKEDFSVYDMTHADEVMRPVSTGKSQTLNARMGTGGNQVPVIAYSFAGNIIGRKDENGGHQMGIDKDISFTLNTIDRHAVCATEGEESAKQETFRDKADCLFSAYGTKWNGNASANNGSLFAKSGKSVRRLTPLECERLQGLPDSFTLIDDKTCSDTARYKALGNGMAQPVADWIFRRIKEIAYGEHTVTEEATS